MQTRTLCLMALGGTALLAGGATLFSSPAVAPVPLDPAVPRSVMVQVTITNLTRGQTFSPPLVVVHDPGVDLFEAGMPASIELQALAEDGDAGPLMALLGGDPGVLDLQQAAAALDPGASTTLTVMADPAHRHLSIAGMLVSTNDTFFGLDAFEGMAAGSRVELLLPAWDAGTEVNSENCAFIPGPPCGGAGVHDPTPAEGYVHISSGIQGIGDLGPEADWRNPVARVVLELL